MTPTEQTEDLIATACEAPSDPHDIETQMRNRGDIDSARAADEILMLRVSNASLATQLELATARAVAAEAKVADAETLRGIREDRAQANGMLAAANEVAASANPESLKRVRDTAYRLLDQVREASLALKQSAPADTVAEKVEPPKEYLITKEGMKEEARRLRDFKPTERTHGK